MLVVDDEGLLELYGELLRDADWRLELLDWEPDLIVLDLFMPVMDGYEFLRRLQERAAAPSIPVLVISGGNPVDPPVGGDVLLRKPFDIDGLTAAIEAILERSATRQPTA